MGGLLIDGLEVGVKVFEVDLINYLVGYGGYFDCDGYVMLDVVIMDDVGYVGVVVVLEDMVYVILVVCVVMEWMFYIMLVGEGVMCFVKD